MREMHGSKNISRVCKIKRQKKKKMHAFANRQTHDFHCTKYLQGYFLKGVHVVTSRRCSRRK